MTELKKISEYKWEVPQTGNMRVPGIVYADESMLKALEREGALKQVANVATLPGIVKASLAMPDIHQGYGFSIGGVAAFDWETGVISPGGVGYDINCLLSNAYVLNKHGYTLTIAEMEKHWQKSFLKCQNFKAGTEDTTPIVRYLKIPPQKPVFRLTTTGGDEILATADHPFWTPKGMIKLERLSIGEQIARYPFEGVPYEAPGDEILIDEDDITRVLAAQGKGHNGNALGQILNQLKTRDLLPLRADSPQLPYLIKLLGFIMGDGTSYFDRQGKGITCFFGEEADLEAIRADVEIIGFMPSRIYKRDRSHKISTAYGQFEFQQQELSFRVTGSAFAALLAALGSPIGRKNNTELPCPSMAFSCSPLATASLFGGALGSRTDNSPGV